MLALDQKVTLSCTDTGNNASGTIVRIVGNRVDVMLDGGGNLLVSLNMQKPGPVSYTHLTLPTILLV